MPWPDPRRRPRTRAKCTRTWSRILSRLVQYETVSYRRAQLYEEVWADPVEVAAKRYGVSGSALAKTCRKLQVPLPGRGYWARKRAGQKLKRPPLPTVKAGGREEISVSRWHRPKRPKPILSPETEAMIANEETPEAAIAVPATLDQAHNLVVMSARLLQGATPLEGVVRCRDRRCLDIAVSPGSLDRALRIMDAVLSALKARGLAVEVTDVRADEPRRDYSDRRGDQVPSNVTRVKVAGEWIRFALMEKVSHKRPPPPPPPRHLRGSAADWWQRVNRPPVEHVPTGELTLSLLDTSYLSVPFSWRDGKRRRLEECLNTVVSSLYLTSDAIKAHRAEHEMQRAESERAQKRHLEEQRSREEEAKRAKELEDVVGQWRFAHDVRAYVAEARRMVADADLTMAAESPCDKWLNFALSYAEKIDPLAELRADIARVVAEKTEKTSGSPTQAHPSDDSGSDEHEGG